MPHFHVGVTFKKSFQHSTIWLKICILYPAHYVAIMEQILSARELCFDTISSFRATLSLDTTSRCKFLLKFIYLVSGMGHYTAV